MLDASPIESWLEPCRTRANLRLRRIGLSECRGWQMRDGRLQHETGGFFSMFGLRAWQTQDPAAMTVAPFIDQPEVGLNAFAVRMGAGGIEWLLQAKTEPGNVGGVQVGPTVQATRSNRKRLHGGAATRHLDLFDDPRLFLADSAQSEQGTSFLLKFNRNAIVAVPENAEIEPHPNWLWTRSEDLRTALGRPYILNTDTRSVICIGPWSLLANGRLLFSADALQASFAAPVDEGALPPRQGFGRPSIVWDHLPLDALDGYRWSDDGLIGPDGWAITMHDIAVEGREVAAWCQPLLGRTDAPEVTLVSRVQDGALEVFVRRAHEVGFGGRWEYGPTLQDPFPVPPPLAAMLQGARRTEIAAIDQSDEGGRFINSVSRYSLLHLGRTPARRDYRFGRWVRLSTLEAMCRRSGATTNELRTLASLLLSRQADEAYARVLGG